MDINNYLTAREAADAIGITYSTLLARVRKNKIDSVKKGWSLFISKSEVEKQKKAELKNANNKNMEKHSG